MPHPDFHALLEDWGRLWGVPGLASLVLVRFQPRLRRSLGRCDPATGRVSLHPDLQDDPLLAEVLCHEAAHMAVRHLHGPGAKPHGSEWRDLVQRAGFPPRTRVTRGPAPPPGRPGFRYRHRCPVCQAERLAKRPVKAWRCRACVEAGLEGHLIIERMP